MPTIEEQKSKLRNTNSADKVELLKHQVAVNRLLKDCQIQSIFSKQKKAKVLITRKEKQDIKIVTSKNYLIKITDTQGNTYFKEELSADDMLAKSEGYISTELVLEEETKQVTIYKELITTISTDLKTLQGVK